MDCGNPNNDSNSRLYLRLLKYDERLSAGRLTDSEAADVEGLSQELDCIDLLHRVWPRSGEQVLSHASGTILGDFRLIREIGRGGMGVVYEAEQLSLCRRVAVKTLPFVAELEDQRLNRFQLEARVAAALVHPHIVPVYAIGCEGGVYYYSMQLIVGRSLAALIGEWSGRRSSARVPGMREDFSNESYSGDGTRELGSANRSARASCGGAAADTVRETDEHAAQRFQRVVEIGVQTAEALDYAHQCGVLHRDVKPANLIVDVEGKAWITDFGLARFAEEAGLTQSGDLLGTLKYVSPERLRQRGVTMDPRGDVYSLGVTLYEALALTAPFDSVEGSSLISQILDVDPPDLRQRERRIPVDLATIVAKSINKEPAARYESAADLAADLKRYQQGLPIVAHPATLGDRMMKWTHRHRALVRAASAFAMTLFAVLLISAILMRQSLERTSELLYAADLSAAYSHWEEGQVSEAAVILEHLKPTGFETDRRGEEWRLLKGAIQAPKPTTLLGHDGPVREVARFPDGRQIASVGDDGTLRLWDARTGKLVRTIQVGDSPLHSVAVAPDGKRVAVGSLSVQLCDLENNDALTTLLEVDSNFESLAFSLDGKTLYGGARYADVAAISLDDGEVRRIASGARLFSIAISPSHGLVALPRRDELEVGGKSRGVIQLWDEKLSRLQRTLDSSERDKVQWSQLTACVFSTGGRYLLAGAQRASRAFLFDATTGRLTGETRTSKARLVDLDICPQDRQIVIGYENGDIELFQFRITGGRPQIQDRPVVFSAHPPEITSVQFLDAKTIISAGVDGAIRVWHLPEREEFLVPTQNSHVRQFRVAPNGNDVFYATESEYGIANISSRDVKYRSRQFGRHFSLLSWSADSAQLHLVLNDPPSLVTVDHLGRRRRTIELDEKPRAISCSQDGSLAAIVGTGVLKIWSLDAGTVLHEKPMHDLRNGSFAFSPDNRWLAYEGRVGEAIVLDAKTLRETLRLNLYHPFAGLSFSDDSRQIVSSHADGVARIWSVADGSVLAELPGHEDGVHDASFSSDHRTVVTVSETGVIRLWLLATGRMLGVLYDPQWDEGESRLLGFQRSSATRRLCMGVQLRDSGDIRVLDWQY